MQTKQQSKGNDQSLTDDVKEMIDDLSLDQKEMFIEFVENTNSVVTNIKESDWGDGLVISVRENKEYKIQRNDKHCENQVKEILQDGEMWKIEVGRDRTTAGLDDWIETVLSVNGWERELCGYDGCAKRTKSDFVYWRSN